MRWRVEIRSRDGLADGDLPLASASELWTMATEAPLEFEGQKIEGVIESDGGRDSYNASWSGSLIVEAPSADHAASTASALLRMALANPEQYETPEDEPIVWELHVTPGETLELD